MVTDPSEVVALRVRMVADGARSSLLALASVLHRRNVEIISATFEPIGAGQRIFTVTFEATAVQVQTVAFTYMRMVDVLDVSLVPDTGALTRDNPDSHRGGTTLGGATPTAAEIC